MSRVQEPRPIDQSIEISDTEIDSASDTPVVEDSVNDSWLRERGFTDEYNMHFNQREFLERQAATGDILAAQLLGYQMLGSDRGNEYLTEAAVRGSIQSLIFLSSSAELVADGRLISQRESQDSEYDQHEYGVRALEYLFVAEIRGDHFVAPHSVANLMRRISYTDEDVSQACVQAVARYADLERHRYSLGLPPFDNSAPPAYTSETRYSEFCDQS